MTPATNEPQLTDAHFDAPACLNCGAAMTTPYCPQCGQQQAERFRLRTIGNEAWDKVRVFEFSTLAAIGRTLVAPGRVAREFVLGRRKKHVHPIKLLLIAIGVLLLVLAQSRYLNSANAEISRAMELAQSYGQWSFSIGIVAILAASTLVFWKRLGYNLTEHLVLAIYGHFLIIVASIVSLLPTLIWRAPDFLAAHKAWSAWTMGGVEMAIVAVAYQQFFLVDLKRQWWRLLLAVLLFAGIKWLLLRGFAWLLVKAVMTQLA